MFLGELFRFFYFLVFWFLFVFVSSYFRFFRCFYFWLHLFTSLLLHCLWGTLFLCCYRECYGFDRAFFTLRHFLPNTPSCFYQGFPGANSSDLEVVGPPLRFEIQNCSIYFLNHTVFGSYIIIRELYLNLSKYVDKLIVAKILINFKHIS